MAYPTWKKLSKGDKVSFYHGEKKETVNGVVTKGGSNKVSVRLVGSMDTVFTGGVLAFRATTFELPAPDPSPSSMDGWEVKSYKSYPRISDETLAYAAYLYFKGKKVVHAMNRGQGASDEYCPVGKNDYSIVEKLEKDALEWAQTCGSTKPFEPVSSFISWYMEHRNYGVTARMFIQDGVTVIAELMKG